MGEGGGCSASGRAGSRTRPTATPPLQVRLALLLGSDYTDGVHGVGIVNAMEIMRSFDNNLEAFGEWARSWRDEGAEPDAAAAEEAAGEEEDAAAARRREFKRKHRNARRSWTLGDGFPSGPVRDAYLAPVVDKDEEACEWARPDLHQLRQFCVDKFGWSDAKADETLLPVMQAYEKTVTQTRIDAFFPFETRFARFSSDRLAAAVSGQPAPKKKKSSRRGAEAGGEAGSEAGAADAAGSARGGAPRKARAAAPAKRKRGRGATPAADDTDGDEGAAVPAVGDAADALPSRPPPKQRARRQRVARGRQQAKAPPAARPDEPSSSGSESWEAFPEGGD